MNTSEMTAEQLREEFSSGASRVQNEPTPILEPTVQEPTLPNNMEELMGLSSQELAEKIASGTVKEVVDEQGNKKVVPVEETAPVVKKGKETIPQIDESIVSRIDESLFKTGKLKPFNTDDGKDYIRPKTWEELSEVIDANMENVRSQVKGEEKEVLFNEIFQGSSPAMRFILENANSFKSPEQMLPLIQSVQAQDDFAAVTTETAEEQEYIITAALTLQGFDPDAITDELADLIERGKLKDRAEKLKPIVDRYTADRTEKILLEQEAKNKQDMTFWNSYFDKMNTDLISSKDLDGMKIKQEHKNIIATALLPNQEIGGLPLYNIIDNLVGTGNVRLLAKIALLASDEAAFDNYSQSKKSGAIVGGLQKTLRESVVSTASDTDIDINDTGKTNPQRSQYGSFLK